MEDQNKDPKNEQEEFKQFVEETLKDFKEGASVLGKGFAGKINDLRKLSEEFAMAGGKEEMIKKFNSSPDAQQYIQKRIAEGASLEQIKLELMGQPPMQGPEGPEESPQVDVPNSRMRGQTPEVGQPVQAPMRQMQPGQMQRQ